MPYLIWERSGQEIVSVSGKPVTFANTEEAEAFISRQFAHGADLHLPRPEYDIVHLDLPAAEDQSMEDRIAGRRVLPEDTWDRPDEIEEQARRDADSTDSDTDSTPDITAANQSAASTTTDFTVTSSPPLNDEYVGPRTDDDPSERTTGVKDEDR